MDKNMYIKCILKNRAIFLLMNGCQRFKRYHNSKNNIFFIIRMAQLSVAKDEFQRIM